MMVRSTCAGSPTKPRSTSCSMRLSGSRTVRLTFSARTRLASFPETPAAEPPARLIEATISLLIEPARTISATSAVAASVTRRAVDELAANPEALEHRADLRAAAVDDHRVDADRLEQHDVLGEGLRQVGVAHRMAAVLNDKGRTGVALQIGQRLDQRLGLGEQGGMRRIIDHATRYTDAIRAPQFSLSSARRRAGRR